MYSPGNPYRAAGGIAESTAAMDVMRRAPGGRVPVRAGHARVGKGGGRGTGGCDDEEARSVEKGIGGEAREKAVRAGEAS